MKTERILKAARMIEKHLRKCCAAKYIPPKGIPEECEKYYAKCRDSKPASEMAESDAKSYCSRVAWNICCSRVRPDYEGCTKYGKGWGKPYSGPLSR